MLPLVLPDELYAAVALALAADTLRKQGDAAQFDAVLVIAAYRFLEVLSAFVL